MRIGSSLHPIPPHATPGFNLFKMREHNQAADIQLFQRLKTAPNASHAAPIADLTKKSCQPA